MTARSLAFIVPGDPDQHTGGYIYGRRMVEGLRRRGWDVDLRGLAGRFPIPDQIARSSMGEALDALEGGSLVIVDGLAMGAMPEVLHHHRERLVILSLVHHLLADETGLEPAERDRLRSLERDALDACAGVITTSTHTAARVVSVGVDAARVHPVPPGTEPAPASTGPPPGAPPRILCVATVTPRKGHDVLVSALAQLGGVPWSCVFAGSLERAPDHARAVRRQIEAAGLSDRIALIGECDAGTLDELYRSSSVFALASYHEGFGMVLTEAMARGLPIVATTAGAIPTTVPADAGMLVPPGDATALATALRELVGASDEEREDARRRRVRLGAAARRYAAGLPDADAAAGSFESAILALARVEP